MRTSTTSMPKSLPSSFTCLAMRFISSSRLSRTSVDEAHRAEHPADGGVDDRAEPRAHHALVAHGLVELQRIGDPVAREGIDDEPLLVGGGELLRRRVEVEDALVEDLDRLHDRDASS